MYQSWSTSIKLNIHISHDKGEFARTEKYFVVKIVRLISFELWATWSLTIQKRLREIFDSEIVLTCKSSGNQGHADPDITSNITPPPPKKNIYIYNNISHSLYLHGGHPQISTSLMRIHSEIWLQNIAYIITISNIFSLYLLIKILWLANRSLLIKYGSDRTKRLSVGWASSMQCYSKRQFGYKQKIIRGSMNNNAFWKIFVQNQRLFSFLPGLK